MIMRVEISFTSFQAFAVGDKVLKKNNHKEERKGGKKSSDGWVHKIMWCEK